LRDTTEYRVTRVEREREALLSPLSSTTTYDERETRVAEHIVLSRAAKENQHDACTRYQSLGETSRRPTSQIALVCAVSTTHTRVQGEAIFGTHAYNSVKISQAGSASSKVPGRGYEINRYTLSLGGSHSNSEARVLNTAPRPIDDDQLQQK
jgi:hypothetical protein